MRLENVTVTYDGTDVLTDVNLEIEAGSWMALIGPNGAGKSSLIKCITGLVPYSGRITIDGNDVAKSRSGIAYMPQQPVLPSGMTVAEYVLLGRTAHLGWLARESTSDRDLAADALRRMNLESFASREVSELSGGEVQRVGLARALCQDSHMLVLDEPTSALDLGHQMMVLGLVEELRAERGLTVVSAIHDLTAAGRFADTAALVSQGRLVMHGPVADVLNPALLSEHYQTELVSITAPDGSRVILPALAQGAPS